MIYLIKQTEMYKQASMLTIIYRSSVCLCVFNATEWLNITSRTVVYYIAFAGAVTGHYLQKANCAIVL